MRAIPIWLKLALAGAALSGAFGTGWTVNGWRLNGKSARAEAKASKGQAKALASTLASERRLRAIADGVAIDLANKVKAREATIGELTETLAESLATERDEDDDKISEAGKALVKDIIESGSDSEPLRTWDVRLREFANGSDFGRGDEARLPATGSGDVAASLDGGLNSARASSATSSAEQ